MSNAATTRVRLTSIPEVIESLPYVCGYYPHGRIVMLTMKQGGQVLAAAAVDQPVNESEAQESATEIAQAVAGSPGFSQAATFMLVTWADEQPATDHSMRMVNLLADLLLGQGLQSMGSYLLTAERITGGSNDARLDLERDRDAALPVAAEFAGLGRVTAPSRAAVVASVASTTTHAWTDCPQADPAHAREVWQRVVLEAGVPDLEEAKTIAAYLRDRNERDALLGHLLGPTCKVSFGAVFTTHPSGQWAHITDRAAVVERLRVLSQLLPEDAPVDVSVLLAILAHEEGLSMLAQAAIERALAIDPTHVMAGLAQVMLHKGVRCT